MLMPTPARLRVPQLELFRPAPLTPTMPPAVYRTTVQLLARLLREHAQKAGAIRAGREAGHE
jgi:hypothetical protein